MLNHWEWLVLLNIFAFSIFYFLNSFYVITLLFYNVRVLIDELGYIFHSFYVTNNLQIIHSNKYYKNKCNNSTRTSNKFAHSLFWPSNLIIRARINQRIRVFDLNGPWNRFWTKLIFFPHKSGLTLRKFCVLPLCLYYKAKPHSKGNENSKCETYLPKN